MAELTCNVVLPADEFIAHHDADAQTVRYSDVDEVARRLGVARGPDLREGAGLARVLDLNRQAERGSDGVAQAHVLPCEVRRQQDAPRFRLDHAGDHDAYTLAAAKVFVFDEDRLDPLHKVGDETLRLPLGREAGDARELVAHEVGHHHEGARRTDVHGHHAALSRIDIEEGGLATPSRLARGPFEDGAIFNELVHKDADRPSSCPHETRQVGPRDGLVGADQIEGDPSVDLPGGAPSGHAKMLRRSRSHLSCYGSIYLQRVGAKQALSARRPEKNAWLLGFIARIRPFDDFPSFFACRDLCLTVEQKRAYCPPYRQIHTLAIETAKCVRRLE